MNNPVFALLTGLTGILGLLPLKKILAVPDKMVRYSIRSFSIVEDKIGKVDAIKILYKNQSIQRLTLTRIAVWNGGNKPIKYREDIPDTDLLRISLAPGYEILQIDIMDRQKQANEFKCSLNNSIGNTEAIIEFAFLKKKKKGQLFKLFIQVSYMTTLKFWVQSSMVN